MLASASVPLLDLINEEEKEEEEDTKECIPDEEVAFIDDLDADYEWGWYLITLIGPYFIY